MKIAIVTGASSGMGKEFVRQIERFYKELDEIWVISRSEKKLEELKKSHKIYIRIFAGDMEEDLVYKQVKNRLENQNPDIRMLVNAAGFGKTGTVEEIAKEDKKLQLRMIDLNCKALLLMTRLCVPYMQPGSHILELDSLSAFQPVPYITTYAATKRGPGQGADYIGLGPFRFTQTKRNLSPVLGLEGYRTIMERCRNAGIALPVVAIGGITAADVENILATGVTGIALSGALLQAENTLEETQRIINIINRTKQ